MADAGRPTFLRANRLEQETLTIVVGLAMAATLAFMSPAFLDANNLVSLQTAIAPALIVGIGMMTLFMIGRFDLSVGSVMGMSGIVVAMALDAGAPVPLAFAAGLLTGIAVGAFNGLMVAYFGISHLITTLGVLYMLRGIIEVVMVGEKLGGFTGFPPEFTRLAQWAMGGVSGFFVFALLLCAAFEIFLRLTVPGRRLLFLGGNPQAARAIGLNTARIQFFAFVLSGGLAAFAGIMMTARAGMANRYMGEGLEMQIFIACLIGGGSIAGGKGSYIGAFVGVVFITLMTNAFNLLGVPSEWQAVGIGTFLIGVIMVDAIIARGKSGSS